MTREIRLSDFDLGHLVSAASRLQSNWESRNIDFCFIGGLAVQHWGEPRLTGDVDATVVGFRLRQRGSLTKIVVVGSAGPSSVSGVSL